METAITCGWRDSTRLHGNILDHAAKCEEGCQHEHDDLEQSFKYGFNIHAYPDCSFVLSFLVGIAIVI